MYLQQLVGTTFSKTSNLISCSFALSESDKHQGYLLGTCLDFVTGFTIRDSHLYCISHSSSYGASRFFSFSLFTEVAVMC